jgi:histone acetyltransferase (RNA polymerase elongator complex component)
MKHFTIPFFIPHRGCPHKCVFCDQRGITGEDGLKIISPEDIVSRIDTYLSTMPASGVHVQVGFFGGSFTGIADEEQRTLLAPVKRFIEEKRVHGIRVSTRPDLIDEKKVCLLKSHHVNCIELGVQSVAADVLEASLRGHSPEDVFEASRVIKSAGLELVHQLMLGLPLSSYDKEFLTARTAVDLGAGQVRIYPVIVMKGTELAKMWKRKEYVPLETEEAVERAARLINFFRKEGVKVIRCGLHPSEGLISGEEYLAGPFHPAFGHLARQRAESMV